MLTFADDDVMKEGGTPPKRDGSLARTGSHGGQAKEEALEWQAGRRNGTSSPLGHLTPSRHLQDKAVGRGQEKASTGDVSTGGESDTEGRLPPT